MFQLVIEHMFDYYLPMVNLHLIDESCENCIQLFAALEELMAKTGPVAILFTAEGSIVLYMEDRFILENKTPERSSRTQENPSLLKGKEYRRRSKNRAEKRINIPNSKLGIIYKETRE